MNPFLYIKCAFLFSVSVFFFFLLNNKSSKLWAFLTEHKEYSSITLRETPGTF